MGRGAGMIAPRHKQHIAILDGHGLVEAAIIGLNALEGEALGRIDTVIIGLLQQ